MAEDTVKEIREKFQNLDVNLAEKFTRSSQAQSQVGSETLQQLQTYVWSRGMTDTDVAVYDALSAGYEESELTEVTSLPSNEIQTSLDRLEKAGKILRRRPVSSEEELSGDLLEL